MCDLTIHSHSNGLTYRFVVDQMTYISRHDNKSTRENIAKYHDIVRTCSLKCDPGSIPYHLTGLHDYPELDELHLDGYNNFDITLLSGLTKLRKLFLYECVVDLRGLEFVPDLTELVMINVRASGMAILSCLRLELLWLKNTPIESLEIANKENLKGLRLQYSPSAIRVLKQMMPLPSLTTLGLYFHYPGNAHTVAIPDDLLREWCDDDVLRPFFSDICRMLLENPSDLDNFQELVHDLSQMPGLQASNLWIGSGDRCEMAKIVGCCQAFLDRTQKLGQ